MTAPSIPSSPTRLFFRVQGARFYLRGIVFVRGLAAAAFWTVALAGAAWTDQLGFGYLNVVLLAVWLTVSSPALLLQVAIILDVIALALIGQITVYPALMDAIRRQRELDAGHLLRPQAFADRAVYVLLYVVDITSPLSALSTWCFIVLCRAPTSKHATRAETRREIRLQVHKERQLVEVALARSRAHYA